MLYTISWPSNKTSVSMVAWHKIWGRVDITQTHQLYKFMCDALNKLYCNNHTRFSLYFVTAYSLISHALILKTLTLYCHVIFAHIYAEQCDSNIYIYKFLFHWNSISYIFIILYITILSNFYNYLANYSIFHKFSKYKIIIIYLL